MPSAQSINQYLASLSSSIVPRLSSSFPLQCTHMYSTESVEELDVTLGTRLDLTGLVAKIFQEVFNPCCFPTSSPMACSPATPLGCPPGDLTAKHGPFPARAVLTDPNLPLSGPDSGMGLRPCSMLLTVYVQHSMWSGNGTALQSRPSSLML